MTKQCGNCKWWDRDDQRPNKTIAGGIEIYADCLLAEKEPENIILPESIFYWETMPMMEDEGEDCPCFEEVEE